MAADMLICVFIILFYVINSDAETKTSSVCWSCFLNSSHFLTCAQSEVIVILEARYGYNEDCPGGVGSYGGCTTSGINKCCKPGGQIGNCFLTFVLEDWKSLEKSCANKATCTFNSIRYGQVSPCYERKVNSYTVIKYRCDTSVATTNTPTPISTALNFIPSTIIPVSLRFPPSTSIRPTGSVHPSTDAPLAQTNRTSGNGVSLTSGELGSIMGGSLAAIILLATIGCFIYRRKKISDKVKDAQLPQETPGNTETDVSGIHIAPNMDVIGGEENKNYNRLNGHGSEPNVYEELDFRNKEASNDYYNVQYVNVCMIGKV